VLTLLVELLAPSVNERLRRRAMATLGELLFYAATQAAEEAQPDGENGSQPHNRWPFPGHTALSIARMLRHADDEIAQHYGAKTVENVATAGGPMAEMLAVPEVAAPLCVLAGGTTANSHLRATAQISCDVSACMPHHCPCTVGAAQPHN
jgi:serine/threonine-protein kinase ULK4